MNDCIDSDESSCDGDVYARATLSGSGMRFPRCDKHYAAYVERMQPVMDRICRDYPDTDTPPSWFDPTYAGERWNDDY